MRTKVRIIRKIWISNAVPQSEKKGRIEYKFKSETLALFKIRWVDFLIEWKFNSSTKILKIKDFTTLYTPNRIRLSELFDRSLFLNK